MSRIIKSLEELKSLNEDHFVIPRVNGMITGRSGLNVAGFWKLLKNNLQNLFVLQAFNHIGLDIVGNDITITDNVKANTFATWLEEKRKHEATHTQSTAAAYAGTAEARPVIGAESSPAEEEALVGDWDTDTNAKPKTSKKKVLA